MRKKKWDYEVFQFLMEVHIVGCPEHNLIIFTKWLSIRDTNFVPALAQKQMEYLCLVAS